MNSKLTGTVLFALVNLFVSWRLFHIGITPMLKGQNGDPLVAISLIVFLTINVYLGLVEPSWNRIQIFFWTLVAIIGAGWLLTADHLNVLGQLWRDEVQTAFGLVWLLLGGLQALGLWLMNRPTRTRRVNIIERYG